MKKKNKLYIYMKIIETKNNIKISGAKINTAGRPEGLAPYLNYVNLSLIIGLPASGKSSLIKTLLNGTKEERLYNNIFHSIYYISPSTTIDLNLPEEKYIQLSDTMPLEEIMEDIIENESGLGEEDESHNVLIICDDCVNWLNGSKKSLTTFRKVCMNGRHILGKNSSLMCMLVSQKIKSVPLTLRSQANQVFFFDSTKAEKAVFADEYLPLDIKEANILYKHIYDEPFNFLFVNLSLPIKKRIFKNFNSIEIVDED